MMHCSSHYETHCILHIHPLNTGNSIPECTLPCVVCERVLNPRYELQQLITMYLNIVCECEQA